jgi:hypothetical protein
MRPSTIKVILLSVILKFIVTFPFASVAQSPGGLLEWGKVVSGNGYMASIFSKSLAIDQNMGDVYSVGVFEGQFDFDPGTGTVIGTTPINPAYRSLFINKFNSFGNHVWTSFIEGSTNGEVVSGGQGVSLYNYPQILVDPIGNLYIIGNYIGVVDVDPSAAVYNLPVNNSQLPTGFILKMDPQGSLIWAKAIGDGARVSSFFIDNSQNIYTAGCFTGSVDFDPGPGTSNLSSVSGCITQPNEGDLFISKLDSAGNFLWVKGILGTEKNKAGSIVGDGLNNIYLTGEYINCFGQNVDFNPGSGVNILPGTSGNFLLKLTSTGGFVWVQNTGGGTIGDLAVENSGILLQAYLNTFIKTDNSGIVLSSNNIGTAGNVIIERVETDVFGNTFLAGKYSNSFDADPSPNVVTLPQPSSGYSDIFLLKIDSTNNLVWAKTWNPTAGLLRVNGLITDQVGRVYLSGLFDGSGNLDIDPGNGQQNINGVTDKLFVVKFSPPCVNSNITSSNLTFCDSLIIQGVTYYNDTSFTATLLSSTGCDSIVNFTLNSEATFAPTICLVTVDSMSNSNVIIFEKPTGLTSVDSFYVYREVGANIYQIVGALSDTAYSVFYDYGANPNSTSFKYKIASLNVCNQTSSLSPFHSTIHLQYLGSGNFQWTNYLVENVPNPVLSYNVYRDNNSTGNFQLIQVIPGNNNTFTDVNFSSFPNSSYRIEVNWFNSVNCNPTSRTMSSFVTSRSNILSFAATGISDLKSNKMNIYPNPTSGSFVLDLGSALELEAHRVEIKNTMGQVLFSSIINSRQLLITSTPAISHGVFMIYLLGQNEVILATEKLVVQ